MIVWGVLNRALPIRSTFGDLYFIGSDSGIKHLKQKGIHLIFPLWNNNWIRSDAFNAVLNFGLYPRLVFVVFFLDYLNKVFNTLHECHPSSALCSHQFNFWWPVCNFTLNLQVYRGDRWNNIFCSFLCSCLHFVWKRSVMINIPGQDRTQTAFITLALYLRETVHVFSTFKTAW